ncbi:hypothetical protein UPYG_G00050880 [Umbra pygmaea]|uniref:THAP-type domain-containing protein n=1 Tax=Umbra pygmaea TaxID=75934 RepID=A0ABD0X719_UMBPY
MNHGRKCSIPGCTGNGDTFHSLPKEPNTRRAWLMFVYKKIPVKFDTQLFVCSNHFTKDSFENLGQFKAGFAKLLLLKRGAAPTVRSSQPHQIALQEGQHTKDAACQTDAPGVASHGTQLSRVTLRPHIRSKGVQGTVLCRSVAAGTTTPSVSGPLSSTPFKGLRPAKRPRLEFEEEVEDVSYTGTDPQDSTFHPTQSVTMGTESAKLFTPPVSSYGDAKYIVFEQCLLSLFETCPVCTRVCNVLPRRRGSFLAVDQLCPHCQFFRQWKSQPVIGSTPVGNLQLSAAIYFCGASFSKMKKLFESMQLRTHNYDSFRRHARTYLEPAIIHSWTEWQTTKLQMLSEANSVILRGDMRADSPGHSAKYGSYTMMDVQTDEIAVIQLVQSNEVGGRSYMEKEGLLRALDLLHQSGVKLDCIITDRHPQIQKLLSERKITHYYDAWHVAKGLSKKLEQLGKDKDCALVKRWHKSIVNHLYWCATSSVSGTEKVAKWKSVLNHIQDVHSHSDPAFPKCVHQPKASKDRSKWFQPGSSALNRLDKVLTNKRYLTDVEKLSHHYQTSTMEQFHNVIQRFAPKNVVFPFIGMLCRLYLAAMHFNENAERPQRKTAKGKQMHRLMFREAKRGGYTVKQVKTEPTICYILNLMRLVFEEIIHDPVPYVDAVQRIPVPQDLCAQLDRPSIGDAVTENVSRFNRGRV